MSKKAIPRVFFTRYSKPVMTEDDLRHCFSKARKGEKILYYTGFLAEDAKTERAVARLRKVVTDWMSLGLVVTTQRRLEQYSYEYYIVIL